MKYTYLLLLLFLTTLTLTSCTVGYSDGTPNLYINETELIKLINEMNGSVK